MADTSCELKKALLHTKSTYQKHTTVIVGNDLQLVPTIGATINSVRVESCMNTCVYIMKMV